LFTNAFEIALKLQSAVEVLFNVYKLFK